METVRICGGCGTKVAGDAPQGLCPECLLKVGLGTETGSQGGPGTETGHFTAPSVEELGKGFPQLEVIDLLGQGGMGAVYKARQRGLNRVVALKILPPQVSKDRSFSERFTREAQALARLNHPNIVTVHDFGEANGLFYFVMEFIDGLNLRQMLRTQKLAPKEALAIVPQICAALQYAHEEGIVHRDIKPENILVDKKGRVKIADFGLARLLGAAPQTYRLTQSHQAMGTPHYMAPEQFEKPLEVDHRADIYSLGVVFYEMLTGELPLGRFAAPSEKVQMDVRLDDVVLRALEKEPQRRYQHVSDVMTDMETIAGYAQRLPPQVRQMFGYEYKSKATLFGLPLMHIATGMDPATGKKRIAKGIIALGDIACGVFAFGGVAYGGLACGGLGIGVISFSGMALGLIAIGGAAIGLLFAFGGGALGPIAVGGGAIGYYACGGGAWGAHVLCAAVQDPAARAFFEPWVKTLMLYWTRLTPIIVLVFVLLGFIPWGMWKAAQKRSLNAGGRATA
ncbi:MAG TPA: serine/threonine-protein kinase [Candidatus Dormibacteraeota bacterium]|nr:serine/threonine-protein kinase [Candidatus Dormibacteraeota bacterium]